MSIYCGKCDLWDCMVMAGKSSLSNTEFYLGKHRLYIKDKIDLLKYAPYLVSLSYSSNGKRVIVLQNEPYIDYEEKEILSMYVKEVKRYYNYCKRHKIEFIPERMCGEFSFVYRKELLITIAERFKEKPYKVNIKGLHTKTAESFRKIWYDDLVQAGMPVNDAYTWVYGFERNLKRVKEELNNEQV